MEEQQKETTVKLHPHRLPITFVSVVFLLIAVYFIVQGVILARHHSIEAYNIGVPASDSLLSTHEGIILRQEELFQAKAEGYVSFYILSGEWAAEDQLISSIDPSGSIQDKIRTLYYGHSALSYMSRLSVQNAIRKGVETYDPMDFSTVERVKGEIGASVMNALLKEGGSELQSRLDDLHYTTVETEKSGFFLTWYDGYESVEPGELKADDFIKIGYAPTYVESGLKVERGDVLYKLALDNRFQLCFLMTESEIASLSSKKTISVRMSDGMTISGSFTVSQTADGKPMGIVSFVKYGANFTDGRFRSFRIVDESVTGYKIPESAIVEKSFFVVPKSYIATGGATGNEQGVLVQGKDPLPTFVPATVYVRSGDQDEQNFVIGDDSAYVYSTELVQGMVIVSGGDEKKTMALGMMASVEGCFQINNGYCIFKPIVRIRNSLDTSFVIISASVRGGLKSYDRIVLNAEGLTEREIIFE